MKPNLWIELIGLYLKDAIPIWKQIITFILVGISSVYMFKLFEINPWLNVTLSLIIAILFHKTIFDKQRN